MLARLVLLGLLLAVPAVAAPVVAADELPAPSGPVVLTVAGEIGRTNRGPSDDFEDGFLAYHEKRFERAAAFDRAMLEALGLQTLELEAEHWPKGFRFEGPWLRDVLAAVEAEVDTITLMALDGYAVEITGAELEADDWLLALKRDGAYLGIGQRGPTWAVYRRKDGQRATQGDEARWPWSVFYIEVR